MKPLTTTDGHNLPYTLEEPHGPAIGSVVLAHGITVNRDEYNGLFSKTSAALASRGFSCIRFDFRGHGESAMPQERMTVRGEREDLRTACEFMRRTVPSRPLHIVACSFGAVSTILYASTNPVDSIVLWNPVLDMKRTFVEPITTWARTYFNADAMRQAVDTGYLMLENFRIGTTLIDEMRTTDLSTPFRRLAVPILVFHGDADDVVPFQFTAQACAQSKNCQLVTLAGAGHGFLDYQDKVIGQTAEWLEKLGRSASRRGCWPFRRG